MTFKTLNDQICDVDNFDSRDKDSLGGTKPISKKNTRKCCYSNPGNKYGEIILRKK